MRVDRTGAETRIATPLFADPSMTLSIFEILADDHIVQRRLCQALESVADRLPVLPAADEISWLCKAIRRVTSTHFGRAERLFAELPLGHRPGPAFLSALREMHQFDRMHGEDLASELWWSLSPGAARDVGKLSYMLRCFFDGCRRAIALKESGIEIARRGLIPG
nr:hemerythrin domain-containing protein [uncultured Sphingomonas sp.]